MSDAPRRSEELSDVILVRVLRLNAAVQGVAMGLFIGVVVFIATNWLVVKGGNVVGPHLALLGQYFIGYEVSLVGSLIGFVYGFAAGFVSGYSVSTLYNRLASRRMRANDAARD